MTTQPREPLPLNYESPFRLVVKARSLVRPRGFVWEIVRAGEKETSVRRSSQSFKTMEEAFNDGSIALGLIRKRAG